jgi:hypothetical protein
MANINFDEYDFDAEFAKEKEVIKGQQFDADRIELAAAVPVDTFCQYIEACFTLEFCWFSYAYSLDKIAMRMIRVDTTVAEFLADPLQVEFAKGTTLHVKHGGLKLKTLLKYIKRGASSGLIANNWQDLYNVAANMGQIEWSAWVNPDAKENVPDTMIYRVEKASYSSVPTLGGCIYPGLSKALYTVGREISVIEFPKDLARACGSGDGVFSGQVLARMMLKLATLHNPACFADPPANIAGLLRCIGDKALTEKFLPRFGEPALYMDSLDNDKKSIFANKVGEYNRIFSSVAWDGLFPIAPERALAALKYKAYYGEISDISNWLTAKTVLKVSTRRPCIIEHEWMQWGIGTAMPDLACIVNPTPGVLDEYLACNAIPAAVAVPFTQIWQLSAILDPLMVGGWWIVCKIVLSTLPYLVMELHAKAIPGAFPVLTIKTRVKKLEKTVVAEVMKAYYNIIRGKRSAYAFMLIPTTASTNVADANFDIGELDLPLPTLRAFPSVVSDEVRIGLRPTGFFKSDMMVARNVGVVDPNDVAKFIAEPVVPAKRAPVKISKFLNKRCIPPYPVDVGGPIRIGDMFEVVNTKLSGKRIRVVAVDAIKPTVPVNVSIDAVNDIAKVDVGVVRTAGYLRKAFKLDEDVIVPAPTEAKKAPAKKGRKPKAGVVPPSGKVVDVAPVAEKVDGEVVWVHYDKDGDVPLRDMGHPAAPAIPPPGFPVAPPPAADKMTD